MRRFLLPVALLLIGAVVAVLVFGGGPDVDTDTVEGPEGPQAEDQDAGAFEGGPARAAEAAEVEDFDPRAEKVGNGAYGLFGTVVDEGGQPVPNAWVGAYSAPFPLMDFEFQIEEIIEQPLALTLEPMASVRADEKGQFRLEGVYGRGLYLAARADKRLTRGRQAIKASDLLSEEGIELHTVAGAALNGHVRDEFGAPVAGAEVFVLPAPLYMVQAFRNRDIYVERVYTDGGGNFSIDAVPAGAMLWAQAFDGATHPGSVQFGPLLPDSTRDLTVALAETGSLSGKVLDDDGEPAVGAKVVAVPLDFRMALAFIRDIPAWIAITKVDGSYEFPRLPKRNYMLAAQADNGRSPLYSNIVTGDGSLAREDMVVQSRHRFDGRLVDGKGRPILGAKVALKSIPTKEGAPRAFQGGGMPDGAAIFREMLQEVAPEFLPAETWTTTGAGGRFTLAAWDGARLEVSAPDYSKTVFKVPSLEEGQSAVLILQRPGGIRGKVLDTAGEPLRFFVVNAEQRQKGLTAESPALERAEGEDSRQFRERRNAARKDAQQELLAQYVGENEVPITGEAPPLQMLRNVRMQDDGTGLFSLDHLMPGTWNVDVRAEGFVVGKATGVVVEEGEITKDVEVTMNRGAVLRGVVRGVGTREPVAGATVTVGRNKESGFMAYVNIGFETTAFARTAADGSFELTGVDPGMDWVHALAEDFAPASQEMPTVEEGEVREDIVLEMATGGTIQGHVYDRHGNPLPGRMVAGVSPDSQDFWQTPTDENGAYLATHVKPGNYFLVTAALDDDALFTGDLLSVLGGTSLKNGFVQEGKVITVDIEDLSAGGCRFEGQVLSGGSPVRNAAIFAMATDGGGIFDMRIATARTDGEGKFLFKSMAPGEYRMNIRSEDWEGAIDFFVDDIPEDYQVLEAPRSVVRGRVLEENTGAPVADATVLLIRDDQGGGMMAGLLGSDRQTEFGSTEDDGTYEFEGVSPGEYHIEVRVDGFGGGRARGLQEVGGDTPPLGRGETRRFDISENQNKSVPDIRLPIASAVRVLATSANGEDFNRGFQIQIVDEAGEADEMSGWGWNGTGLVSGVTEGSYTVRVSAQGYATETVTGLRVSEGEIAEVSLKLQRGVSISARVLDVNGQPLMGASMKVLDAQGNQVNAANSFGNFFGSGDAAIPLGSFAPGSYTVEASWQGRTQKRNVSLVAGGSGELVEFNF